MIELINRIGAPYFIQAVIEGWNGIFLFIMIFSLIMVKRSDKRANVYVPFTNELTVFFTALFLYNLFDLISITVVGDTRKFAVTVQTAATFFYFLLGAFQSLFLLLFVKKHIADKFNMPKLGIIVFAAQLLYIPCLVLLAITPFTNALYYYDAQNYYCRGPFYWVWYDVTLLSFVFIALVFIVMRKKTDRFIAKIIGVSSISLIIACICNFTYKSVSFTNIFASIAELIIYMYYEKYRTECAVKNAQEIERLKSELAEANNKTLMLQIQPHFINNSLMALSARCLEYPQIYEDLTNFSTYLRSNFEALGDTQLIAFKKEMRSIKAYIALEQGNFKNRLKIEYDIQTDDFYIPALSVQPLVENAVRHGVATYDKGGSVCIKTYKRDGNIIIEVTDDGSGKSSITEQQQDRKGIGIANSRARIRSMTDGRLDIIETEHGTTARITIPDLSQYLRKKGK